jgi:hypothetical protein
MATLQELKELAIHAAKGTAPANYSVGTVDEALRGELKALAGSVNQFMKNRYDIYDIVIAAVDEVVPQNVIAAVGAFAEVRSVPNGQKTIFKRKLGRQRAKQFITRVAIGGLYETFRLDSETFSVEAYAIGGAVSIDFERFMNGEEDMAELVAIVQEGLVESVYVETMRALHKAAEASADETTHLTDNKVSVFTMSGFNAKSALQAINRVKGYGTSATIFATPEFVAEMGADAIVLPSANGGQGVYAPQDIDAIHNTGYINIFRGTPVVQLPNTWTDETYTKMYLDPQLAYVLPTNGDKIVKVVLEGDTQINDFKNKDRSMEIHFYKKMGVALTHDRNWAILKNTNITPTNGYPAYDANIGYGY